MTCQKTTNIHIVLPPGSIYQNQFLAWRTQTPLGSQHDSLSLLAVIERSQTDGLDFDLE